MTQYLVEIRHEAERGCGYRKPGKDGVGIYLVGDAFGEVCERLPFPLDVCPACGGGIKFSRGFTWINPLALFPHTMAPRCCDASPHHQHGWCPLCSPGVTGGDKSGLMWVGEKFYSPQSFVQEAMKVGVSKRMSAIPKGFKVGEDWIYLAHLRAIPVYIEAKDITRNISPGVFYVFKPKAVELVIKDSEVVPDKAKALVDRLGEDKAKIIVVKPIETQEPQEVCCGN